MDNSKENKEVDVASTHTNETIDDVLQGDVVYMGSPSDHSCNTTTITFFGLEAQD